MTTLVSRHERMHEDLRPLFKVYASNRMVQRLAALWLGAWWGLAEGVVIHRERLREACRYLRVYDVACFSYYMADERKIRRSGHGHRSKPSTVARPWFHEVESGWTLTDEGRAQAERFFA